MEILLVKRLGAFLILFSSLVLGISGKPKNLFIIGGEEAIPGEFPWLVSIQAVFGEGQGENICGGTIVNDNHVVTAAHCLEFHYLEDLRIVAGAHYLNRSEPSQQIVTPIRATRHRDYVSNGLKFDIAIIEVTPPFHQTERVQQLAVPPPNLEASGHCLIAGWGWTETDMEPNVLIKAEVPVVSKEMCQSAYGSDFDPECSMCAGRIDGGVDNCNGDTGIALVCKNHGQSYFAGIASWGYLCAQPNKPGVYTDVSKFIEWLQNPVHADVQTLKIQKPKKLKKIKSKLV